MRHIPVSAITLTFGLASLLAGCASLEQAPLTYSSVNTMGLSVAAATPQQPGLDVTIGFMSADVAYTPVAVAKKCGTTENELCYRIEPVFGSSDGQSKSSSAKAYDKAVHDLQDAKKQRENAQAALRDENASFAKAENECEVATGNRDGFPETTDAAVKRQAIDTAAAACSAFDMMRTGQSDRLAARNAAIAAAEKQEKNAEAEVGRLAIESSVGTQSKDSYSVFGTFNGNATANNSGGVLQLGKTFSTGVAAQRYSEGLKTAAATVAMKQCLEALTAMLTAGKITGDDMVKAGMKLCSNPADTSDP